MNVDDDLRIPVQVWSAKQRSVVDGTVRMREPLSADLGMLQRALEQRRRARDAELIELRRAAAAAERQAQATATWLAAQVSAQNTRDDVVRAEIERYPNPASSRVRRDIDQYLVIDAQSVIARAAQIVKDVCDQDESAVDDDDVVAAAVVRAISGDDDECARLRDGVARVERAAGAVQGAGADDVRAAVQAALDRDETKAPEIVQRSANDVCQQLWTAANDETQDEQLVNACETYQLERDILLLLVDRQRARALRRAKLYLQQLGAARAQRDAVITSNAQQHEDEAYAQIERLRADMAETVARHEAVVVASERYVRDVRTMVRDAVSAFRRSWADAQRSLQQAYAQWPNALSDVSVDGLQRLVERLLEQSGVPRPRVDVDRCNTVHDDQSVAPPLTPFQRAAVEIVTGFNASPGLLLYWDVGTGKSLAAAAAIVRHLEQHGDRTAPRTYGAVVIGFSVGNITDLQRDVRAYLNAHYGRDGWTETRCGGSVGAARSTLGFTVGGGRSGGGCILFTNATVLYQTKNSGWPTSPHALIVVDEAHRLFDSDPREPDDDDDEAQPLVESKTELERLRQTQYDYRCRLLAHTQGKLLLLTATPAANDDARKLLQLLNLLKRRVNQCATVPRSAFGRPRFEPDPIAASVIDAWFTTDAATGAVAWINDRAQQTFVRDWAHGIVSYATFRFDQSVYPAIQTTCDTAQTRACVYKFDASQQRVRLLPSTERLPLSDMARRARIENDVRYMVAFVVKVPLSEEAYKTLVGKTGKSGELQVLYDELLRCLREQAPRERTTDACANATQGVVTDQAAKKVKWTSGGGFDYDQKCTALRVQIDSAPPNTKHVVLGSSNERVPIKYYFDAINEALTSAGTANQAYTGAPFVRVNTGAAAKQYQGSVDRWFDENAPGTRRFVAVWKGTWDKEEMRPPTKSEDPALNSRVFALALFNHPRNARGEYIQVLLLDAKSQTGTSAFADVLHQMSPSPNVGKQQQAWGRVLRLCARSPYTLVSVYTYVTTLPGQLPARLQNDPIEVTPDELLVEYLRSMQRTTRTDLLLDAMRDAAVDRSYFGAYVRPRVPDGAEPAAAAVTVERLQLCDYFVYRALQDLADPMSLLPSVDNVTLTFAVYADDERVPDTVVAALRNLGDQVTLSDADSAVSPLVGTTTNEAALRAALRPLEAAGVRVHVGEPVQLNADTNKKFVERFYIDAAADRAQLFDAASAALRGTALARSAHRAALDLIGPCASPDTIPDLDLLDNFLRRIEPTTRTALRTWLAERAALSTEQNYEQYYRRVRAANAHRRDVLDVVAATKHTAAAEASVAVTGAQIPPSPAPVDLRPPASLVPPIQPVAPIVPPPVVAQDAALVAQPFAQPVAEPEAEPAVEPAAEPMRPSAQAPLAAPMSDEESDEPLEQDIQRIMNELLAVTNEVQE